MAAQVFLVVGGFLAASSLAPQGTASFAQPGQRSYSVLLIHFPVCLLGNAVVNFFWPTQLIANTLGLLAAFVLSLLAGALLYRLVAFRQIPARGAGAAQASPLSR